MRYKRKLAETICVPNEYRPQNIKQNKLRVHTLIPGDMSSVVSSVASWFALVVEICGSFAITDLKIWWSKERRL